MASVACSRRAAHRVSSPRSRTNSIATAATSVKAARWCRKAKRTVMGALRVGRNIAVESRSGAVAWGRVAIAPFPLPAHRTGRADFPHPALQPTSHEGMRRVATLRPPAEPEDLSVVEDALGRELP